MGYSKAKVLLPGEARNARTAVSRRILSLDLSYWGTCVLAEQPGLMRPWLSIPFPLWVCHMWTRDKKRDGKQCMAPERIWK